MKWKYCKDELPNTTDRDLLFKSFSSFIHLGWYDIDNEEFVDNALSLLPYPLYENCMDYMCHSFTSIEKWCYISTSKEKDEPR